MRIPANPILADLVLATAKMKPDGKVTTTVRTVQAIAKAVRQIELKLRQETYARRQVEWDNKAVREKLEVELARMVNMVETPGTDFVDPQPTEPLGLVIRRAENLGEEPSIWACHKCGKSHRHRSWAESCCALKGPHPCGCGKTIARDFYTACDDCIERGKLLKAERLSPEGYEGWIHSDHVQGYNDGYFEGLDELEEACEANDVQMPAYVWACIEEPWSGLDAYERIETEMEDHHEEAIEQVVDIGELLEFMKAWNAKQTLKSYSPDTGRVIVLDAARFAVLVDEAPSSPAEIEEDHRVA